jgi:threonylcarbamoyladenosine tRNA methylthiotransferase MtaB
MTFAIFTLGCKLNFAESSALARGLTALGFTQTPHIGDADFCIVNSCAVTQTAEKKSRQAISKIINKKPAALVFLTGCYATLQAEALPSSPQITVIADKKDVVKIIAERLAPSRATVSGTTNFFPAYSIADRTRSFLKVQDGCDYHCAYCTIPAARGTSRNISIDDIVAQANAIAASGAKEIILTGINIGDFGKSTGETLLQLLQTLENVDGIERYRISSIEPNLLIDNIIEFVARSPKFLPHFHIPLQAGHDRILQLMRRRYNTDFVARKIQHIFRLIPDAFIGIDVIAGFPTETDDEFDAALAFIDSLGVAYLHVFPYSRRPNTVAAALPQTPQHKITGRSRVLTARCKALYRQFCVRRLGSEALVLFEDARKNERMTGLTENYIRVEIPYDARYAGRIVRVKLCGIAASGNVEGVVC